MMHRTKTRAAWMGLIGAAVVLVSLVSLHGQEQGAKALRVAVVDVESVFNNLDERAAFKADITGKTEEIQREQQLKQTELRALEEDLKLINPDSPNYETTLEKYEMKVIELKSWTEFMQRKLEREQTMRMELLYEKIVAAVEDMATKSGYDMVFFKDVKPTIRGQNQQQVAAIIQSRKVLYASPSLDITAGVTQKLNNEYNNQKKPGGAKP